jgi:phosphoribosylformylglycinamidine synthase subunit PurQ / glutaminase
VLTEAGLLPGALQKNAGLKFLCRTEAVVVTSTRSVMTRNQHLGDRLLLPINHFEGNYTCSEATLAELQASDRIVLTYEDCPNGSMAAIAGICNEAGNVVGLMPHPERACHPLLGGTDGAGLLASVLGAVVRS